MFNKLHNQPKILPYTFLQFLDTDVVVNFEFLSYFSMRIFRVLFEECFNPLK